MPGQYLSDEDYKLVTSAVPIVCVDVLPVRKDESGKWHVGMILRATGSQAGKITLIGGRVQHSERLENAIHRHLRTDLQVEEFRYFDGLQESVPFMVQQYFQEESPSSDEYGFDPTKHAVGLSYLVEITDTPQPVNEAAEFVWLADTEGREFGFNQQTVANRALNYLDQTAYGSSSFSQ